MEAHARIIDFEFADLLKLSGLTFKQLASILHEKGINVSPAMLCMIKNGQKNSHPLKEQIKEILKEYIQSKEEKETIKFLTEAQRRMLSVLEATYEDREFALIVGPSGIGKTYIVEKFAEEHEGVVIYKVAKAMSLGDLLRELCKVLKLPEWGTNYQKFSRIKETLKGKKMLIVDEADLLADESPNKFLRKIEIFRELANVCAVVLVGLPELDEAIYANVKSYIYSRMGYYAYLKEPEPQELIKYCELKGIKNIRQVVGASIGRGYFRYIDKVAKRAKKIGEELALSIMYAGRR
jgi:DNA transposition AAA+ family ATPase